jgi:uncharacterized Zn-binding protein involved in type VI secretion
MAAVQRLGDRNSALAQITSVLQTNVYANNILIAVNGSGVAPHDPLVPLHTVAVTANGSTNVFVNNIRVTRTGDADNCGHPRILGSTTVFIN